MLYVRLHVCRAASALAALLALGPSTASAAPAATVVTLITGDRVTLDSTGKASVQPAANRKAISFTTVRVADHTHVIPSDAVTALRTGQLDPRLFDVTELVAAGYDKRATIPVILTGVDAVAGKNTSALYGAAPRNLALVNGVAAAAAKDGSFWRSWKSTRGTATYGSSATNKLWLDGRRKLSAEENLEQIGADVAHERGFRGDGVKVAVVDSGIDSTHPDLAGQVKAQKNFVTAEEDDRDYVGHGTHVASVIAGTGALSNGRYLGVAPNAELIDAKACSVDGCLESAIVEGLEWAVDQGARIINLSFGATDTQGEDLVEAAVNKLSKERGVLVVAAAGNDFVFGLPVGSPASAESALAVGALNSFSLPSDFSQRGSLEEVQLKPELIAPGENITAARSSAMVDSAEGPAEGYFTATGTSMAAPHVAGAAALLSQRHPDWQGDKLKAVLIGSAKYLDGQSVLAQGAGLVNVPAALALSLRSEPAAVSFGRAAWPHDDDEPIERKVTLYNESDRAATVELTLEARDASNQSIDTDMFSLSASTIEIAAGGQAEVTLTADARKGSSDGLYSGALVATGLRSNRRPVTLRVPFILDREVESYDLDLRFVGRDGEPADPERFHADIVGRLDVGFPAWVDIRPDSTATVRLARGLYAITSGEYDEEGLVSVSLVYPGLELERDTEVVIDARVAKPVKVVPPLPDAEVAYLAYNLDVVNFGTGSSVDKDGELLVGRLGPDVDVADVGSSIAATWVGPGVPENAEYLISWAKYFPGELLTGYSATTDLEDFAEVDTKFARGGLPTEARFMAMAMPTGPLASFSSSGMGVPVAVPGSKRAYYLADGTLDWRLELSQFDFEADLFDSWEETASFEAGEKYEQQWNQAVFGPGASSSPFGRNTQLRYQDALQLSPALLADNQARAGGFAPSPNAVARVYRNGELLKELKESNVYLEVPAGSARYRAEFELDRPDPAELSTHVELAWEFVSETASGEEPVILPLSYIRFLPELNQNSAAQSGATIELPIRVEPQPDADVPEVESLTVDVSYDDGQSWTELEVEGKGADWSVQLDHPQQSGYVSLRAAAIDADDNTVEVTIIRAYRLE